MEKLLKTRTASLFPFLHMFSFLILLCSLAVLLLATQVQAQRKATSAAHHVSIEQNGFFFGEEQYYLVTQPLIHVYYLADAESDVTDAQAVQQLAQNSHEIFVLVRGKWIKKWRAFSKKPEVFISGNSCNTRNELDLPGGRLRGSGLLGHAGSRRVLLPQNRFA